MRDPADDAKHPEQEALARFLRGEAFDDERKRVVRHLLAGCAECARDVQSLLLPSRPSRHSSPVRTTSYGPTIEAAGHRYREAMAALQLEREEARKHFSTLLARRLGHEPPDHELKGGPEEPVEQDRRFHTWGQVELLLAEGRRLAPRNPRRALDLVQLAHELSQRLSGTRYGVHRVRDLQARTLCLLGSLLRIRSDFHESERVFQRAKAVLAEGTGDPIEKAEILVNEAVLYAKQGRYERAFALLDHVMRIARRFEDTHLQGKALITKGVYSSYVDEEEKAIQHLYAGIDLIDPQREPRLLLVAWHNVFFCLSYVGRNREALEKLPYVRSLHEKFGNRMDLLRLHWVEARIKADLGELEKAEAMFRKVRGQFIEAGIGYEAAMISLDLASLYLQQGKSDEVADLAQEMLPIFKSRDVHREAIAALIVFQRAVERETINLKLVGELESYLRHARNDPTLRFRPSC